MKFTLWIFRFFLSYTLLILIWGCEDNSNKSFNKFDISCVKKAGIEICTDTLYVEATGILTDAILYDDNYYLFFLNNKMNDSLGNRKDLQLLKVSIDGKNVKVLQYPKELDQPTRIRSKIINDSLYLFSDNIPNIYYLNGTHFKKVIPSNSINNSDHKINCSRIIDSVCYWKLPFNDNKSFNYACLTSGNLGICKKPENSLEDTYYLNSSLSSSFQNISEKNELLYRFYTKDVSKISEMNKGDYGIIEITSDNKILIRFISN